ncbi:uncharacterized protein LOC130591223 [Beta vulgaris subsp. vulgaris]|uniref:uncharacterized protein LOC130591223 n=1 Tax=Beta vulgaris subsp. vulgaris TaxID=3555 RepID=UPI0025474549|nr:uncharacterized protein LOC130591223 [Beta vulgaris subsp. vulgaris]
MCIKGADWWNYQPSSGSSWYWKSVCEIKKEKIKLLYSRHEIQRLQKYSIKEVYQQLIAPREQNFQKGSEFPKQLQEMVLLRLHWWIKGWQETFPYSINDVLQNPMCLKRGSTPRKLKEYHGSSEHQLWRPPPQTALKWNIDASFDPSCNLSAVGGVLRDDSGSFICLFSCPIPPLEINSAEVYAIFRAIKLSISSPPSGIPHLYLNPTPQMQ